MFSVLKITEADRRTLPERLQGQPEKTGRAHSAPALFCNERSTPMKTTITAKNMTVSPAITARIMKKTATMERYLKPDTQMFVRMRKERNLLINPLHADVAQIVVENHGVFEYDPRLLGKL